MPADELDWRLRALHRIRARYAVRAASGDQAATAIVEAVEDVMRRTRKRRGAELATLARKDR